MFQYKLGTRRSDVSQVVTLYKNLLTSTLTVRAGKRPAQCWLHLRSKAKLDISTKPRRAEFLALFSETQLHRLKTVSNSHGCYIKTLFSNWIIACKINTEELQDAVNIWLVSYDILNSAVGYLPKNAKIFDTLQGPSKTVQRFLWILITFSCLQKHDKLCTSLRVWFFRCGRI